MSSGTEDRKILLDYESVCADIERILERVGAMRTEKYFVQAMGEKAVGKIRDGEDAIRKRLYGPFQLVVIGDFKRGKSTLINALLGEAAVPTAVTPETVTINRLLFSETPGAEAVLKNRKRVSLSRDELTRDALEELVRQLPAPIASIDIKLANDLLRDITIVDTPGTGDLMKAFDEQIADYLVNADAVIDVVSSRAPLSDSEQAFLSSAVIPQSFSRIFLVVNMADTLETEENLQKVKKLVEDRAGTISDKLYVQVLSALDEFCRKKGLQSPEPRLSETLERNFLEFETALRDDVLLQKDVIKSMRGIALVRFLLSDISSRVRLVQNSLKLNVERLEQTEASFQEQDAELRASIEKYKSSLSASVDDLAREAKDWMRAFLARLKNEIEGPANAAEVSDIQRYFQFYLMDLVKSAVMACAQRHRKEINDLLSNDAKSISGEVSQRVFGGTQTQIADCIADISWTNADTAMFVGDTVLSLSGLSSVVGPLYVVGQAIAGAIRQKTISKKQTNVIAPILQNYDSIAEGVITNIDTIYARLKKDALSRLDELYQNQVEVSMEAIEHAKQIASDENTKVQDVLESFGEALKVIESCMECLKDYD